MQIGLEGFPDDVTESDILAELEAFGCTINKITIHSSPIPNKQLAMIDVATDTTGAKALARRINGHVWRGKTLRAEVFVFGNR